MRRSRRNQLGESDTVRAVAKPAVGLISKALGRFMEVEP